MVKLLYITDLDGTLVRSVFPMSEYVVNQRLLATLMLLKPHSHIALVTSASRKTCEDVLSAINLTDFFDHIVTGNDVDFIKPHPEGYLSCMEYFDTHADRVVVFEDSRAGLEAAKGAGAHVCLVTW